MTATETAMQALAAALNASASLPAVRRDPVFDNVLEEITSGLDTFGVALALRIGDAVNVDRRLGDGPEAFEITRNADVEWFVAGAEAASLQSQFDDGIDAIFDAIAVDRTLGDTVVMAEVVDAPEIGNDDLGGKAVLTALIRVQLTFTSPRPY